MTEQKTQNQDKFIIRLPAGLRKRIRLAADNNNRSMNAEVVALLEKNTRYQNQKRFQIPLQKFCTGWLLKFAGGSQNLVQYEKNRPLFMKQSLPTWKHGWRLLTAKHRMKNKEFRSLKY